MNMKSQNETKGQFHKLPACAAEYVKQVLKKMRYRRKVRQDVQAELAAHFEDGLKDCKTDQEKEQKAQQLIADFGNVKLLAVLLRRAKKRCRPLWRKVLVRSMQALGIIVVYLLISSARLFVGTPNIKVNYVAWLNDKVRQGRDQSLNAKPYYDKAAQLASEAPAVYEILPKGHSWWLGDMNEPQRQAIGKVLEENAEALQTLRKGAEKPYYWVQYTADLSDSGAYMSVRLAQNITKDVLPVLGRYKKVGHLLGLRTCWRARHGDLSGAFDDYLALQRFGAHLEAGGLLIEQLVGIAIEAIARRRVTMVLDKVEVPAGILEKAQQELQRLCDSQEKVVSLQAEEIFLYDWVQRAYTDDGQGGGRPLKEALPIAVGDWKDALLGLVTFSYPGRQKMVERIELFYSQAELLLKQTPRQAESEDKAKQLSEIAEDSAMLKPLAPAYARIGNIAWRMKTNRRALVTILAVMRYEKQKGRYPASLNELVLAGYLDKLPMDPYSGGPLVYKRKEEGFLLYSFGANLADDGGKLGLGSDGKPRMWADNGDWVFWPVPESDTRP